MELHVLCDEFGTILAAVQLPRALSYPATTTGDMTAPTPRPVPQPGQYTADVTVPDDFAHLTLMEVCDRLVVEGRGAQAVLKPRESDVPPYAAE
jgi:hypothetical protein